MMVLWFMTAVPTGIILICNYGSDANEVCVVGLKVGYITYSWSYIVCFYRQNGSIVGFNPRNLVV